VRKTESRSESGDITELQIDVYLAKNN